jgi:17beta-estradiol 17-dehydrogenase / very-long-chain 3-oxoacyl-CoA reductase
MDALASLTDVFGVHIDAQSPFLRAVAALLLFFGAVSVAAPFVSLIRVLLSLFVLPGQSVRACSSRYHLLVL